ncbi:hypothetical protein I7I48_00971 [Histoplasma ohiense]|nr:hypothetical protein I7I48_00971 [Histoplasma ohiense (nom. inval.)]
MIPLTALQKMKNLFVLFPLLVAVVLSTPTRSKSNLSTVAPSVDHPRMVKVARVAISNGLNM